MSLHTPKSLTDLIGLHLIEGAHEAWAYTSFQRSTEHEYPNVQDLDDEDDDTSDDEDDDISNAEDRPVPDLVFFLKIDGEEYALFNRGSVLKPEMGVSSQGSSSWPVSCDLPVPPSVQTPPLICNLFWRPSADLPLDPTNFPRPLDLPLASEPDRVLVAIDEARNLIVLEVGIESYAYQTPGLKPRVTVPILSDLPVLPGYATQVSFRPQQHAFKPSRLIIGGNPELWIVQDIQLAGQPLIMGDIPGDLFAAAYPNNIRLPTAQPGQIFKVIVKYTGTSPSGEPFISAMVGETDQTPPPLTRIGRRYIARWTPEGRFEPWMAAHLPGRDQRTGEDLPPAC